MPITPPEKFKPEYCPRCGHEKALTFATHNENLNRFHSAACGCCGYVWTFALEPLKVCDQNPVKATMAVLGKVR
jgi:ribosomal protein S27AE